MAADADVVWFRSEDYASIARRIGAFLLDHAFLFALLIVVMMTVIFPLPPELVERMRSVPVAERQTMTAEWLKSPESMHRLMWRLRGWLVFCVAYYTVFRRLRGGTVGYRIMGIRLIDKTGQPPLLGALFKRFCVAAIATLPLGASYLKCRKSGKRQAFHDWWCGTWLVRKRAVPAGRGKVAYQPLLLGTFMLTFLDVEPDEARAADEEADG
ncbi:MAG: RDD family protein [Phycisphaerae bacterium]